MPDCVLRYPWRWLLLSCIVFWSAAAALLLIVR